MAIGGGILPASGTSQFNELTYVTRRAFIPKLVVQLYNSTPLLAALLANSQTASGGVSSVTVPVQGSQFVNAQWSDYSGSFAQPAVQQGAYNAEWNLKLMIAPVPFLGMEGAVQQDYAVIPLIEARMNDATNVMMDAMEPRFTLTPAIHSNSRVFPLLLITVIRLLLTATSTVRPTPGGSLSNTLLARLTQPVRTCFSTFPVRLRTRLKCRRLAYAVLAHGHCCNRTL